MTEVNKLLDIIEEVEPIGTNFWAIVGEEYGIWARENEYSERDYTTLKTKFDRLANMNKRTGNPTIPAEVRRAKHIAKAIHARAQAASLGGTGEHADDDGSSNFFPTHRRRGIGARADHRDPGAGGVRSTTPRANTDAALLSCVTQVADKFAALSDAYIGRSATRMDEVINNEVKRVVRDEVKQAVAESMEEIKDLLRSRSN